MSVNPDQDKKNTVKMAASDDFDFINSKKHKNSLKRFIQNNPNGTTDPNIAHFLGLSVQEVVSIYNKIILKARQKLNINVDSE